ncbi:MAG: hypothetical protein HQ552_14315, partial [Desulfobacteraceae bacterium]|nr:hypothetical protein [Desulfobacteraceae bacterium]
MEKNQIYKEIGNAKSTKNMRNDITTLENRLKAMTDYRKLLVGELKAAIRIYDQLNEKKKARAFGAVSEVNRIRHQIYKKAAGFGYVKQCIDSIPVCKGECCKWHFPKNLSRLDLFITVFSITVAKQTALAEQLALNNGKYQCPVLRKNGCLLAFDSRPLVCSNAYPCFAGASYHEFLKKQRKKINVQHLLLKA